MNTKKDEKKRSTLGFEPDPEVSVMLQRAQRAGLTKGEIINESLKKCGIEVIKSLIAKRTKELASLSFNQAEHLKNRRLVRAAERLMKLAGGTGELRVRDRLITISEA